LPYAGTALLYGSKYSILNDTVKKLEQRSISAGNILTIKNDTSETLRDGIVVNSEQIKRVSNLVPKHLKPLKNERIKRVSNHVPKDLKPLNNEHIKRLSNHVPKHLKPLNNEQLGYYLAGLIDGNGYFSKEAQQLVIVFSYSDAFLAYYIKSRIGFGTVKQVKSKKIFLLIITKNKGLEKIFCLINGKIRTQSKYDIINKYIFNDLCLNIKMDFFFNNSHCLNNHWLAGFSDALAFFKIIRLGYQIKLSFRIKNVNKNLLILIRSFLGGIISYDSIENSYKYDSSSLGSAIKVIKYFDKYFLLSRKHISYLKWRKVYLNLYKDQKLNYLV
jgi:LAGLIDADG endonuclease